MTAVHLAPLLVASVCACVIVDEVRVVVALPRIDVIYKSKVQFCKWLFVRLMWECVDFNDFLVSAHM